MRKGNMTILASMLTMALVFAGVGAGTMAYFSDVEKSIGNTFTAGTIDLSAPTIVSSSISDLKPCETGYIVITIRNDGLNELEVWKHIYNVVCDENGVVEPEQEWYNLHGVRNNIDTVILYDLWIEKGGDPLAYDDADVMIIPETEGLHIADVQCRYIYLGKIAPTASMTIVQSYHMKAETKNWAQSDTMTFDIEFFAQQTSGTPRPTAPTLELPGHVRP